MKANAVNDVMQYVVKLQDRVEQLEVARAVAAGFQSTGKLSFLNSLRSILGARTSAPAARITGFGPGGSGNWMFRKSS